MTNKQIEQKQAGSVELSEDELDKAAGGLLGEEINSDTVTPPQHFDQSKDKDPLAIPFPPDMKPL